MESHKRIFKKKLIAFAFLFLLILLLTNIFYIRIIGENKLIFKKEAEWKEYKNKLPNSSLEYAIFGDSHARNGLNPKYLNNSFNFGLGYEDYTETYYRIKKILDGEKIKIKNFILELDTHTFSDKMRDDKNLFKKLDYYSKFIPLSEISKLSGKGLLALFIKSKIPVIGRGKEMFLYLVLPRKPTKFYLGWTNYTENFSKADRVTSASNKYREHFSLDPNLIENRSFNHFKKILDMAKKNDIGIIIIKYPVSYEYASELKNHNISRERLYEDLFKEINEVHQDYLLLDYFDLFFDNPEYFVNSDHLNSAGAKILSKKVYNEVSNWKQLRKVTIKDSNKKSFLPIIL